MAKTHARFSPSMLDMLSSCLRFKYKERKDDSADEGTEMHKAFETGNMAGLSPEQVTCVQAARDYVDSIKATHGGPDQWHDWPERKVTLKDLTWGTADRVLLHVSRKILHVIDFKATRVEGEHDMQLRTYTAGILEEEDLITAGVEEVYMHILAPRIAAPFKLRIEEPEKFLQAHRAQIEELYERIDDPFLPPSPSEICRNCERAARCPAVGNSVKALAQVAALPVPSAFAPEALVSERDRAIAQVLAGALENWAEQVKKANTEYVRQGGEVPGYKFVSQSSGLRLPKEQTGYAVSLLQSITNMEQILSACTLSVTQLAEVLATANGTDAADEKDNIRKALGDLLVEGRREFLQKTKRVADATLLAQVAGT